METNPPSEHTDPPRVATAGELWELLVTLLDFATDRHSRSPGMAQGLCFKYRDLLTPAQQREILRLVEAQIAFHDHGRVHTPKFDYSGWRAFAAAWGSNLA